MKVSVEQLREVLKKNKAVKNIDRLQNSVSLREQGVDSLDMASLFLAVEENFGVQVPDEEFNRLKTFDEILAFINR